MDEPVQVGYLLSISGLLQPLSLFRKIKPGKFLHIKDDGIYTYMYEIGDDILLVKDNNGEEFMEFFLT